MINGQTAIITGGSRGIGAAVAEKLASMGADLAVIYSGSSELAAQVCEKCIEKYNINARPYKCDVADFAQVKETVAAIKKEMGNIGILVNNAGVTRDGLVAMMKEDDFDKVIDTNLKGAFNMIRHTSMEFIKRRYGRIVNISSVSGLMGNAGQSNYSSSKAGLIGLTKSVARELASKNITCNAVAPGFIVTDMTKGLLDTQQGIIDSIPLKKAGNPEDVADAVAFLISSDYITGEVIRVDGGMGM